MDKGICLYGLKSWTIHESEYLYSLIATEARCYADGSVVWFYRSMPLLNPYVGVWPQPKRTETYAA